MTDWQIETLFATSVVVDDLPSAVDLGALAGSIAQQTGIRSYRDRNPQVDAIVGRARGWADRMTAQAGGAAASPPWFIAVEAVAVRAGTSLPLPPRWDAFWTGLCCVAGDRASLSSVDPRLPATMMEAPDLRFRLSRGAADVYAPEIEQSLMPRRLLLVPGWLANTIVATIEDVAALRVSFVAPSEGEGR